MPPTAPRLTVEDCREEVGDPVGNSSTNAWGGIIARAVRAGLIRRTGPAQARRATSHARWSGVYVGAEV